MFTSVSCLPSDVTVNVPRYGVLEDESGGCEAEHERPDEALQARLPPATLNASSGLSVICPAGSVIAAAVPSLSFHGAVDEIVTLGRSARAARGCS